MSVLIIDNVYDNGLCFDIDMHDIFPHAITGHCVRQPTVDMQHINYKEYLFRLETYNFVRNLNLHIERFYSVTSFNEKQINIVKNIQRKLVSDFTL